MVNRPVSMKRVNTPHASAFSEEMMSGAFALLDLPSQALAVERVLEGADQG
jgi:hypothetical protein